MDTRQLDTWKTTLETDVKAIAEKVDALTAELQKKRQQLELIHKLLDSEIGTNNVRRVNTKDKPPHSTAPHNPTPDEVKERVFEILHETQRPMNIKEIHAEFVRRGLPIPGKGTAFNILVHLSREVRKGNGSRFYRTGKGTYALRRKSDRSVAVPRDFELIKQRQND